ncbi:uncharacterized protein LOC114754092 [Neltuma alba]|uniref:uncharacterized protein LOC114754092 n=1 Tax=Neltuma alba TaxID=207710 RepID=UPI0010A487D1|nr:uncharacterized protein LOC114754092 [Prosopis alba]
MLAAAKVDRGDQISECRELATVKTEVGCGENHKAYRAIKACNLDFEAAVMERKLQLQELEEIRIEAYESSRTYKEKSKIIHDKGIMRKQFHMGDKVLLFKAKFKFKHGKLRTMWDGPYLVTKVYPFGIVELIDEKSGQSLKVNGHLLKLYHEHFHPS